MVCRLLFVFCSFSFVLSAFFDVRFGLPLWYLQTFLKYISSELYSTQDICYNIWEIAIIYTRYVIIYEWYIIIFVRYIIIYERFTPQQMYMYWLYTFILLFISAVSNWMQKLRLSCIYTNWNLWLSVQRIACHVGSTLMVIIHIVVLHRNVLVDWMFVMFPKSYHFLQLGLTNRGL